MAYRHDFPRIISDPHPICWAGFQSDTYTLQQHGWEFSAEQNTAQSTFALAMLNRRLGMKAVTNEVQYHDRYAGMQQPGVRMPFYVAWMTDAEIKYRQMNMPDWYRGEPTQPVDMRPQVITEMREFEDLFMFAGAPLVRTNELVVDPNSVPDLLDRILELQDPALKQHYLNEARADRYDPGRVRPTPKHKFQAQIVSLVA